MDNLTKIPRNNMALNLDLTFVKSKVRQLVINEDLIEFVEKTINGLKTNSEKVLCLLYFKKLVLQIPRFPDPDHYQMFEDDYEADAVNYDPIKWLEAEIEFLTRSEQVTPITQASAVAIADAKLKLSKSVLTFEEVMQMFQISRTTLNRRIAEGMPCHKKGKFVFFSVEEMNEWLKTDDGD